MDEVALPKKTKIAAWIIKIEGVIFFICISLILIKASNRVQPLSFFIFIGMIFLAGILFIVITHFLLKGKKWAWKVLVFLLCILMIYSILCLILGGIGYTICETDEICKRDAIVQIVTGVIFSLLLVLPFVLLLLDRKNYWKIAS